MSKFIAGFVLGFVIGLICISAVMYYAKGDWIEFKLIILGIAELIYKFIYAYFKYILLAISLVIGAMGALLLYEFVKIDTYRKSKEAEIEEKYQQAEKEANQLIHEAKQEAEYIRDTAFNKGYTEGQEKHKKELKSLRNKISAVKSIFKTYPELNECFKKITGWDFEKWLKG
ncbi:MAG TPA: hypothetical protein EYP82_07835 [Hydrogenothermaceae bacterium]|nr:hypothetical protein [Hydrogenothermaceae bacterium]